MAECRQKEAEIIISEVIRGIMLPFWGTSLGAACVFFMRDVLGVPLRRALSGFAAGVMTAASVWSLLIPGIEQSAALGAWAFVPAAAGLWSGVLFLLLLDRLIERLRAGRGGGRLSRTSMLVLAVVLHNVPEGMAVGVVYAGWLAGSEGVTAAGAFALALGIAIQNFPEGAIISMPLRADGMGRGRAFACGVLSGAVEPVGAVITLLAARVLVPVMPVFLGFAAGAMLYVAAAELIPEAAGDGGSDAGGLWFAVGFTVMMALDAALG